MTRIKRRITATLITTALGLGVIALPTPAAVAYKADPCKAFLGEVQLTQALWDKAMAEARALDPAFNVRACQGIKWIQPKPPAGVKSQQDLANFLNGGVEFFKSAGQWVKNASDGAAYDITLGTKTFFQTLVGDAYFTEGRVKISGTNEVFSTLSAERTGMELKSTGSKKAGDFSVSYQTKWYRSDTKNGEKKYIHTGKNYTLQPTDAGKYIWAAIGAGYLGPIEKISAVAITEQPSGPIESKKFETEASITGTSNPAKKGETPKVSITGLPQGTKLGTYYWSIDGEPAQETKKGTFPHALKNDETGLLKVAVTASKTGYKDKVLTASIRVGAEAPKVNTNVKVKLGTTTIVSPKEITCQKDWCICVVKVGATNCLTQKEAHNLQIGDKLNVTGFHDLSVSGVVVKEVSWVRGDITDKHVISKSTQYTVKKDDSDSDLNVFVVGEKPGFSNFFDYFPMQTAIVSDTQAKPNTPPQTKTPALPSQNGCKSSATPIRLDEAYKLRANPYGKKDVWSSNQVRVLCVGDQVVLSGQVFEVTYRGAFEDSKAIKDVPGDYLLKGLLDGKTIVAGLKQS